MYSARSIRPEPLPSPLPTMTFLSVPPTTTRGTLRQTLSEDYKVNTTFARIMRQGSGKSIVHVECELGLARRVGKAADLTARPVSIH